MSHRWAAILRQVAASNRLGAGRGGYGSPSWLGYNGLWSGLRDNGARAAMGRNGLLRREADHHASSVSARPASEALHDPRAKRSSDALSSAFLRLLERKPLDQITIREIAAEAGVHRSTFFRHHPTKEALLDHIAANQIQDLV